MAELRRQCCHTPPAAVLIYVLVATGLHGAAAAAEATSSSRTLQGASFLPLQATLTANIGGMSLPLTLSPFMFKGSPGTPSVESPKKWYRVNCDNPRPTFVVMPGLSGTQLDATQEGGVANCPRFTSPRQVYADFTWLKNLQCFAHMLSVRYDGSRYSNSSGTQMWPWEGGYPDGTMSTLSSTYYGSLWKHMESNYGYRRGVDMFATPWDWRWDFDGLNQIGAFDQIAARIAAGVNQNCGQKAVILAHSMGVNVLLRLLNEPRFKSWRQQYVQSIIMVGGTFSGSAAATWQTKLSGVLDAFPAITNSIPEWKLQAIPVNPFEAAVYQMALGMPSFMVVAPNVEPLGKDHVLVKTPSRSYTIGQQKELLEAIGDDQTLMFIDKVLAQNQALLDAGPVPGIDSYCLYGINQPTPLTLVYGEDIPRRRVIRRPVQIIKGPGDGTVDLKTLRLCNKVAPAANIVEITDPSIDHAAVVRDPAGLAGLDTILAKVGLKKGRGPVAAQQVGEPVANRPAAAGGSSSKVTEERGK